MNRKNKKREKVGLWFWAFLIFVAPFIRFAIGVLIGLPVWGLFVHLGGGSTLSDFPPLFVVPTGWAAWGLWHDINKYKKWGANEN